MSECIAFSLDEKEVIQNHDIALHHEEGMLPWVMAVRRVRIEIRTALEGHDATRKLE